ncbi:hypothetical protein Tco_1452036 [Tanacetum coccineum]
MCNKVDTTRVHRTHHIIHTSDDDDNDDDDDDDYDDDDDDDHDHDHDHDHNLPLIEHNDADDPYIRSLIDYGDQSFHKYDDDDDDDDEDEDDDDDKQYFMPRSTDHKDFDDLDVPPLMKRIDVGDPYIQPLVNYEDKIFPISDDQKYTEQLQLEKALVFSSTSHASTSSSSKLAIDSVKLPQRYCESR